MGFKLFDGRQKKVKIGIDPKDLNKTLKTSHHPLPTMEKYFQTCQEQKCLVLWILACRTRYGKPSLPTFSTPFGRFRWLRMPFGISTATTECQRSQDQAV
jgi:hypothetical protein